MASFSAALMRRMSSQTASALKARVNGNYLYDLLFSNVSSDSLQSCSSQYRQVRLASTSSSTSTRRVDDEAFDLQYEEYIVHRDGGGGNIESHDTIHHHHRHFHNIVIIHGLLGCSRNWRSTAKRLGDAAVLIDEQQASSSKAVRQREGMGNEEMIEKSYRMISIDLRHHGQTFLKDKKKRKVGDNHASTMKSSDESTYTFKENELEVCASDIYQFLHRRGFLPISAMLGHSMGGKIAMTFAQQYLYDNPETSTTLQNSVMIRDGQIWILDSQPFASSLSTDTDVIRVIQAIRRYQVDTQRRGNDGSGINRIHLQAYLEKHNFSKALVMWLVGSGLNKPNANNDFYEFAFDIDGCEKLLRDYLKTDCTKVWL